MLRSRNRSGSPVFQPHSNGHTISSSLNQQGSIDAMPSALSDRDITQRSPPVHTIYNPVPPPYLPGGARSLPGISARAFCLGIALGIGSSLTLLLLYIDYTNTQNNKPYEYNFLSPYTIGYLWRIPFFISVLSTFHYLEFDMTARYNTPDAKVASFLLFNNGAAYTIAHCTAMLECLLRWYLSPAHTFFPSSVFGLILSSPLSPFLRLADLRLGPPFSTMSDHLVVTVGLLLVVLGQVTRSLAMKTAGTSFNHIVQSTKKQDHVLITTGVYAWCRHPSYFGFFWWGLGTQLVLGNCICFLVYGTVLWKFFAHRIANEEEHLIEFFGNAYIEYRKNTPVLIPFI